MVFCYISPNGLRHKHCSHQESCSLTFLAGPLPRNTHKCILHLNCLSSFILFICSFIHPFSNSLSFNFIYIVISGGDCFCFCIEIANAFAIYLSATYLDTMCEIGIWLICLYDQPVITKLIMI